MNGKALTWISLAGLAAVAALLVICILQRHHRSARFENDLRQTASSRPRRRRRAMIGTGVIVE
jgi:hypothetical protein